MPTVNPTITRVGDHVVKFAWTLSQANPDGAPVGKQFADYIDRSVQIRGTFDSGTVIWQGSNDESNYQTCTDPQGNAISRTADGTTEQVTEVNALQRPNSSGGGASQAVVVTLIARRARSGKGV